MIDGHQQGGSLFKDLSMHFASIAGKRDSVYTTVSFASFFLPDRNNYYCPQTVLWYFSLLPCLVEKFLLATSRLLLHMLAQIHQFLLLCLFWACVDGIFYFILQYWWACFLLEHWLEGMMVVRFSTWVISNSSKYPVCDIIIASERISFLVVDD